RTLSPGRAWRTKTTRPSCRATQNPPLATSPTSSSRTSGSSSVTFRNTTGTGARPGPRRTPRRARRGRLGAALEPVGGLQLPRDAGHHDARLEQQPALQPQRALVVQQLLPPVADDVLGDEHGDDVAGALAADALDVGEDRAGDLPVRRVEALQGDGQVERIPLVLEPPGLLCVHRHR